MIVAHPSVSIVSLAIIGTAVTAWVDNLIIKHLHSG